MHTRSMSLATLIHHDDPRLSWAGAVSLERTSTYTRPWRVPHTDIALYYPALAHNAGLCAGVRLTFQSSTRRLAGNIVSAPFSRKLDLCVDDNLVGSVDVAGGETFAFEGLPPGEKRIELWLPHTGEFALQQLEIDEGATLTAWPDARPRWITYGSSITQCGGAASPARTWPALVARQRNMNLTCLGFGGNAHLDVQIARVIRDLPADFISICAGINIYGRASLNERTFASALIGFVQIVREKHPATPILLISPIYCGPREQKKNAVDWTLRDYRAAVAEVAGKLRDHGDRRLGYLDGLQLMGEAKRHLLPDELHPNAEGYEILARHFLAHAAPLLFDA